MKIFVIIFPLSFIGLVVLINLFFGKIERDYNKDLLMLNMPSGNIDCLLFGGSSLQRQACIRNFNVPPSSSVNNDLNVILDGLCSTGNATGCIIKSQLEVINQKIGMNSTTPYNLVWLSDNCNNYHHKSIERPDRLTSCELLKYYAKATNSITTLDMLNQQECVLNPKLCLNSLKSNYIFSIEQNYNLSRYSCGKNYSIRWKIPEMNTYCRKLEDIIEFQVAFLPIILDNSNSNEDFTKKLDIVCLKNRELCQKSINQPLYLNYLINLDSRFNFEYFDKFNISTVAGLFLGDTLKPSTSNKIYKNRIFNFINNFKGGNYDLTLSECRNSSDKSNCFLSFNTIQDAIRNISDLQNFCDKNDAISCSYLKIIKDSDKIGLDRKKSIYFYYHDYESYVLEFLAKKNNSIKYLSYINQNRFWIISFLLSLNFMFIIYFAFAFKNINSVYKYLKVEKLKELTKKLKDNQK